MSMVTRNSRPTASAQPISFLSEFQPGRNFQALQWLPTMIPIPNPELASENACRSVGVLVGEMQQESGGMLSLASHQSSSKRVPFGGVRGMKGLDAPVANIASSPII